MFVESMPAIKIVKTLTEQDRYAVILIQDDSIQISLKLVK